MATTSQVQGGGEPKSAFGIAWESARGKILVVGPAVTIILGMATIYFDRKELTIVLGVLIAILVYIGAQLVREWVEIKIHQEIEKHQSQVTTHLDTPVLDEEHEHEQAYTSYVKIFGLAHEHLVVHATVVDDGSVTVKRTSKLVAHSAGIGAVDQYLISDARAGTMSVEKVECSGSPFTKLDRKIQKATSDSLTLTIQITPPLRQDENIELVISERTPPGSVARTYQEMADRQKPDPYECIYWDITRPTKHFEMKVLIPHSLAPAGAEADVWFGPSRIRCEKEFDRVKTAFRRESAGDMYEDLTLDVAYPIPGLRYVIKWIPKRS